MIKAFSDKQVASILADPAAAVYLLDKPRGANSFQAISTLRKLLNQQKVGFSGTLDPLASGLLIVSTGKATKILDAFHTLTKTYQAEILFGARSITFDLEAELIQNEQAKSFTQDELEDVLQNFFGKQLQTVPAYSAVKVGGQKLHRLARKGKFVDLPKKEIEIFSLEIKKFSYPNLFLEVQVSAGTYIRSLARDLGEALGTGAVLANLRRTKIGHFSVEQAVSLVDLESESLNAGRLDLADVIQYLNQHLGQ